MGHSAAAQTLRRWQQEFGPLVNTQAPALLAASRDASSCREAKPSAILEPTDTRDVQRLIRFANRHRLPLAVRGGGSGKAGGCIAERGGVVLSTARLRQTLSAASQNDTVQASAGITTAEVMQQAISVDRLYGPDPGAKEWCTIGGNVATNAAGPRAFKYGATRRSLLGAEVVTGRGDVLRLGSATLKRSHGLDLLGLLCGAEGTLAVITEVTLRLYPPYERRATALLVLDDARQCQRVVGDLLSARIPCSAVELLDETMVRALQQTPLSAQHLGWIVGVKAALLLELESPLESLDAVFDRLLNLAPGEVRLGRSDADARALWDMRSLASEHVRRMARFKASEDVCVPRHQLNLLQSEVAAIAAQHGLLHALYGHVGDGNVHVNFFFDDARQRRQVEQAMKAVFRASLKLGGVLSGEHGIGRLKRTAWLQQLQPEEGKLLKQMQRAFDPKRVLSPWNLLPE